MLDVFAEVLRECKLDRMELAELLGECGVEWLVRHGVGAGVHYIFEVFWSL